VIAFLMARWIAATGAAADVTEPPHLPRVPGIQSEHVVGPRTCDLTTIAVSEPTSRVIGLDRRRNLYQVTLYTLPDVVEGDFLLISRAKMPIAIVKVAMTRRETAVASMFAIDSRYEIDIGDTVRRFRVIEDRPVR
jgi:hypothetical protein